MQIKGKFGRQGAGNSVILYCWTNVHERSRRPDRVSTGGGCLHLGVSLLLGVEGNVPILFIAVYLCYLLTAVYLGYLFMAVREKKHLRVAWL